MGLTSDAARKVMRGNKSRDTGPELALRRELHARGMRYRANHRIVVDGFACRPDVVFTRQRVAVFVDGCFWHACREHWRLPKSNVDFWQAKVDRNLLRDQRTDYALEEAGWAVVRVWEHEVSADVDAVADRVQDVVAWVPGMGVPRLDDEDGRPTGEYWEHRWCCQWHPVSDVAEGAAYDCETQTPRQLMELIDDAAHETAQATWWLTHCEPCDVWWMGEDACWSCGAPAPRRPTPRRGRRPHAVYIWTHTPTTYESRTADLRGWHQLGYVEDEPVGRLEPETGGGPSP